MLLRPYQICTQTIMDTTDSDITFDDQGVCNYVHEYNNLVKAELNNKDEKKKNSIQL